MSQRPTASPDETRDADIARLQRLLDGLPAPLEPLDVSALDGYLCAVLLQRDRPDEAAWLPMVTDIDGRTPPKGCPVQELHGLVRQRLADLERAIAQRQWFDPWIFELEGGASVTDSMLPWVAGFALALDHFGQLQPSDDARLIEALAVLYLHFDDDDLDDAETLRETIASIEPPADLAEAVQDIVSSVLRIADVTRPRAPLIGGAAAMARGRRGGTRRPGPGKHAPTKGR